MKLRGRVVLDASVWGVWLLAPHAEELWQRADSLLAACRDGILTPLAPAHIYAEVGNTVWKTVRAKLRPADWAASTLPLLNDVSLELIGVLPLLDQAVTLAVEWDRSVYDSLYLALAARERAPLVTADRKLANALRQRAPWVVWLGDVTLAA